MFNSSAYVSGTAPYFSAKAGNLGGSGVPNSTLTPLVFPKMGPFGDTANELWPQTRPVHAFALHAGGALIRRRRYAK